MPTPGSGFYRLSEPTEGLAIGQVAPELGGTSNGAAVALDDLDGDPIRLADLRGRPVWLSFFATWCPPCQEETPVLRDAYARYADDLEMVAVSVQDATAEDVRKYAETYSLPYTIGYDATSAIFHTYQGFGDSDPCLPRWERRHPLDQLRPAECERCRRDRRAAALGGRGVVGRTLTAPQSAQRTTCFDARDVILQVVARLVVTRDHRERCLRSHPPALRCCPRRRRLA